MEFIHISTFPHGYSTYTMTIEAFSEGLHAAVLAFVPVVDSHSFIRLRVIR